MKNMNKKPFKLEQMFGSKTRARLMALFLQQPQDTFFVRELTRRIDAQLNSVRRELKNLVQLGFLSEKQGLQKESNRLSDKKKYYCVNQDFILFEDLRSLFQKVQILLKQNLVQDIQERGHIDYFAFTGRFVDASDIATDIFIVGSIAQEDLEKMISKFEEEIPYEINYTLMTKEEFLDRRQVADRFLLSILNGERVVMIDRIRS
ncbi:MAG: putative transcriptional regulator [Candidatus Uhrbacteria bacterium GW2011_GWF2_39_13]|uniref:Putative transcriptional regulator n=1 Tax=Candidatus Uhrbacteria bacterium GW2011_GWF2_39_13 TaxID=1618995 RepID=A0A0G0Q350_9BACT|nr:MAG: putative transcriptional regulator [Candidatus Uhrbacteria bacterium GW2011_GWF2_39_13]